MQLGMLIGGNTFGDRAAFAAESEKSVASRMRLMDDAAHPGFTDVLSPVGLSVQPALRALLSFVVRLIQATRRRVDLSQIRRVVSVLAPARAFRQSLFD